MSESIVIRGATVVNPDAISLADVLIIDGVIAAVGGSLQAAIELDGTGCYLSSCFVDLHTPLREPGEGANSTSVLRISRTPKLLIADPKKTGD